ncbi:MAG: hypothetical protein CME82_06075 [Halomonas sp.]|nr:hypothetical protein [Halomonas sp.]MBS8271369.1 LysR family transcriptional regulator [Halomonas litopenaei]
MTRQPRLDSLRMFDAAARHLNFRRAAEELTLTQSAVAQRVRQLEDDLGVALFVRQARGLVLTRKGQQYHRRLKPALAMIDEATRQLFAGAGPLKISVTPSFASKWLLPRLPLFRDTYPEVNLELEASERLADFFVDGVDFAIRMGRPPFGEGLQHHRLAGIGLCALCSPDYLARQGGTIDLTDLSTQTLCSDVHRLWGRFADRLPGQQEARQLRFSHTSLAIDAAVSSQGLVLAPRLLATAHLERGELVELCAFDDDQQGFYLVYPDSRQREASQVLLPWLSTQLAS